MTGERIDGLEESARHLEWENFGRTVDPRDRLFMHRRIGRRAALRVAVRWLHGEPSLEIKVWSLPSFKVTVPGSSLPLWTPSKSVVWVRRDQVDAFLDVLQVGAQELDRLAAEDVEAEEPR